MSGRTTGPPRIRLYCRRRHGRRGAVTVSPFLEPRSVERWERAEPVRAWEDGRFPGVVWLAPEPAAPFAARPMPSLRDGPTVARTRGTTG